MVAFVAPSIEAVLDLRSTERKNNDFKQQTTSGEGRIDLGTLLVTRRDDLCRNWSLVVDQTPMDNGRQFVVAGIPRRRFHGQIPTLFESRPNNPRPTA